MLLCDPFAIHTVTQTVVNELHQLHENEHLPRVEWNSECLLCVYVCLFVMRGLFNRRVLN